MKTIDEFLTNLRNLDIKIWSEGKRLRYSAPEGTVTSDLIPQLKQRKTEILAFLHEAKRSSNSHPAEISSISREGDLPLSFAQERIWILNEIENKNATYNIPFSLQLRGNLNDKALEQSIQTLLQRHETLRTCFNDREGTPIQIIESKIDFSLPIETVEFPTKKQQMKHVEKLAIKEAREPFDLKHAPLIRARIVRINAQSHVLLMTMHHIISDGWSIEIFMRELSLLYQAYNQGKPNPLPELPIQYLDFAYFQKQWLKGDVLQNQLDYWKQHLAGAPTLLELPTDHPRPAIQSNRGGSLKFELPTNLTQELRDLSQRLDCTLYMTFLAAFLPSLLYHYTRQEDLVIGSPIANRNRPEIESLIGFFVNTLALRIKLKGNPTFSELAETVRITALDAHEHQDLPFEKLVEELQPERSLSHTPLFQVMFNWQNSSETKFNLANLIVTPLEIPTGTTKFDLLLYLSDTKHGVKGSFGYNRDLFRPESIERMAGHFHTLLRGIIANPEEKIAQLPILTEIERRQILVDFNNSEMEYPRDQCFHQLFEKQVKKIPNDTAASFQNTQISYKELNQKANQVARHLQKLGVQKETLVGICIESSLDMLVGLLGIMKSGGTYIPIDPAYPSKRISYMLEDSGASVVLTQEFLIEKLPDYQGIRICVDRDRNEIENQPTDNLNYQIFPDNLAYVIYTSGSTGNPKGVAIPHGALVNFLWSMQKQPGMKKQDILLSVTTLSFDIAGLELYLPLIVGAQVSLVSRDVAMDGIRLMAELGNCSATIMQATPATWQLLLEVGWKGKPDLKILCGGEALPKNLANNLLQRGSEVWNMYGPTETTIWSTIWKVIPKSDSILIGRPIANTQVFILDSYLQPVPIGVAGELHIGGEGLANSYLHRPELSKEKFISDPFRNASNFRLYKTGDLARYTADGNIKCLGRMDFQVKIRGFRIELGEIETVICANPQVKQSVVVAREDTPGDKRLVAYVIPENKEPAVEELRKELGEKLTEYMIPSIFVFLKKFPLTPNGKVDRRRLPAPSIERFDEESYVAPQNEIENQIADIWKKVLKVKKVGIQDNFFDLGGHSLLLAKVYSALDKLFPNRLSMLDLFRYTSIKKLCDFFNETQTNKLAAFSFPGQDSQSRKERQSNNHASISAGDIAIIGLSGRFPGAKNIDEFWHNIQSGVESVQSFSDEELLARGVSKETLNDPSFVKMGTILEDIDLFDADFFGINANEASITDPQQRIFLEESWKALENAGYNPESYQGLIGIYAGSSMNNYIYNIISKAKSGNPVSNYQKMIGNDKDFLTTRISYHLNLRGPSLAVQTACSTSLVAIHLACENLLTHRCDIALAGGVSISVREGRGYIYQEGMISSPDGHCRAFDANAQGIFGGSGLGIVVLKKLNEALEDGDRIRAVIKGSAINNDGSDKIGYTAPAIDGQAKAIAEAISRANIDPQTINYIEAHGTGTPLGDPIEIAALSQAFQTTGACEKNFCAVGSVKTNIGHLDAAAGVAGLIKTILALEHKKIPPSLNFEKPNPTIDFANSPFFVNSKLSEWDKNGSPRRAGVSSFGIGGTNAHVILEEAPSLEQINPARSQHLLALSAKTETALETATTNLIEHLSDNPDANLADIAYTLQVGRKGFNYRKFAIVESIDHAISILGAPSSTKTKKISEESSSRDVVFMFPGQGSQYVNMGLHLYHSETQFKSHIDYYADFLKPLLGFDFRDILYPDKENIEKASKKLNNTLLAQPVLFVLEYALANLWISWGIKPSALIGHSIGEYVAACLAGVFTPEEALSLVAERGRLIHALPKGSMMAVPLPEEKVLCRLNEKLSLAAVNSPNSCVVSGEDAAVLELELELAQDNTICQKLHTSHAFHSPMMDPILSTFREHVEKIDLKSPKIPLVSTVTGTWINSKEITSPSYWENNLRKTVRFSDSTERLLKNPSQVLLEVGPGQTLSKLVRQYRKRQEERVVLSTLPHPNQNESDISFILNSLGQLWLAGIPIDWSGYYAREKRHRIPIPTYPFDRQRYWIDAKEERNHLETKPARITKSKEIDDWFYIPSWNRSLANTGGNLEGCWLIFSDQCGISSRLIKRLKFLGIRPVIIAAGTIFSQEENGEYTINPQSPNDYILLFKDLRERNQFPDIITHLWGVSTPDDSSPEGNFDTNFTLGFYSLIFLVQALNELGASNRTIINIVTNNVQEVNESDTLSPGKVTVLGPCKVIPQEHSNFACRNIDIKISEGIKWKSPQLNSFLFELASPNTDDIVAYRGRHRWIKSYSKCLLDKVTQVSPLLRQGGVYFITGGLGNLGFTLAAYLAQTVKAKLILIGRGQNSIDNKDKEIASIRKLGGEVLVLQADVADLKQMRTVIKEGEDRFGKINGVIHAAGIVDGSPSSAVQELAQEECERQFRPKTRGLMVLEKALRDRELDFYMLTSSLASVLGGLSFSTYSAANLFLDAFAYEKNRTGSIPWISINWDAWQFEKVSTSEKHKYKKDKVQQLAMNSGEGVAAFERILSCKTTQVIVSTGDLTTRVEQWINVKSNDEEDPPSTRENSEESELRYKRPSNFDIYTAPRNDTERSLAIIWQDLFNIDQISIHDNYFELGGDSLMGLNLVSQAKKTGINLIPQQLFQFPTIAALAEAISSEMPDHEADQGLVIGPAPLTPAMHRFLQRKSPNPHHWNLSSLVFSQRPLESSTLRKVIADLLKHHDALRLRFHQSNGNWQATIIDFEDDIPFSTIDLSELSEKEQKKAIETTAEKKQKSLNISTGPILQVTHFELGKNVPNRLLVIIHHFAMEWMSWAIFWEDLEAAYKQLSYNKSISLPRKTTSFKHWAEKLEEYAESDQLKEEMKYWTQLPWNNISSIPMDFQAEKGSNTNASAREKKFLFTEKETQILLDKIPTNHSIEEVIITALAQTLTDWTQSKTILLDQLRHGRNILPNHFDLARTAGFFIAYTPLILDLNNKKESDLLLSIQNQLRSIPNTGGGFDLLRHLSSEESVKDQLNSYPNAEVLFNFRGKGSKAFSMNSLFQSAPESSGSIYDSAGFDSIPFPLLRILLIIG